MVSRIYLIGMPGSGKTTIGKKLAEKLKYDFVDLDENIIKNEGKSIEHIFEQNGEDYFREIESALLKETSFLSESVISTGGGAPCYFDNMDFINQNGVSIWINVDIQTLTNRIQKGKDSRPMFKNKTHEEITAILQSRLDERKPFYSKATFEVFGDTIFPQEIIKILTS